MTKRPTIASLTARIAELEAQLAATTGGVSVAPVDNRLTRYNVPGIGAKGLNYTPSAVDAIRLYTWPHMCSGDTQKQIVAALIGQGFTPATVRARVKRIFDGTEESCYSEAIRERLGLGIEEDEEEGEE